MQIHNLVQGSPEWHQFRLEHNGASEAAAMLGLSKKVKRSELLAMKHTGIAKEFSDWVQENILDHGHEVEALARPIVEEKEGIDLYPVTCSDGKLSASCDGLTMDEICGWEHKQWNAQLAAAVAACELPDEFMVQPQQCLMVTGAERWKFTVSDGTEENMVSMDIYPDPVWFARIRAGWEQFQIDLDNYTPAEVVQQVIAKPTKDLPALSIQIDGSISLNSNLDRFGSMLKAFVETLVMQPSTDQEFADSEAAVKTLQKAQDALEAAEASALAQTASIDDMRRTVALYVDIAKKARLALSNAVKLRKEAIRVEIAQEAKDAFNAHVSKLNERIGKQYLVVPTPDFGGAMKGLKTVTSLRNSVDTLMANSKIAANEAADKIEINMNSLRELAKDHVSLFADTASIVLKSNDDLVNLINSRINEHKAAEEKKAEELRAKIAEEERVKAEAKARAEQAAIAEAERKAKAEQEAIIASKSVGDPLKVEDVVKASHSPESSKAPSLAEIVRAVAPAAVVNAIAPQQVPREAPTTSPTLTLGKIGTRLGFNLTAEFLRSIGFEPVDGKGTAKLYHESDWQAICGALIMHISEACEEKQAA